ncbi:Uncharacterised protein [uncultured archaeon]|nr:Uncharacterised protein [uncultured archaeon]
MQMRGQLTVEYLFLALLALALIAISLAALVKIRDAGERAYEMELFKSSALDIYNAGEEVCAMGSGNSMELTIREDVSVSQDGAQAVFANPSLNASFSRKSLCAYETADAARNSEIAVRNDGGTIRLG